MFYTVVFNLVYGSRTGRNKGIFCNTLTGLRTCGDKSKYVDSIKNGARVKVAQNQFHHTEISSDNLSKAGQNRWFIGQNIDEDHLLEFSKRVFWRPAIWSTVGEYRCSEWYVGEYTQRTSSGTNISMEWLVNDCWTQANSNDHSGHKVKGSLDLLTKLFWEANECEFKLIFTLLKKIILT